MIDHSNFTNLKAEGIKYDRNDDELLWQRTVSSLAPTPRDRVATRHYPSLVSMSLGISSDSEGCEVVFGAGEDFGLKLPLSP